MIDECLLVFARNNWNCSKVFNNIGEGGRKCKKWSVLQGRKVLAGKI
jgi:hypothetical protein